MENKIREHVEGLFASAPQSAKAYELKEEMVTNLIDKYHDMVASGKTEEAAYNITIASIGDISELIGALKYGDASYPRSNPEARKRSAMFVAIAVSLYVLCVVPVIAIQSTVGVVLMFLMIAIATGLLIFNSMTNKQYTRQDDTVVEQFKEFNSTKDNNASSFKTISGAIWSLTVVIYIVLSFLTGAWHITWVLFLVAVAVTNIVKALMTK